MTDTKLYGDQGCPIQGEGGTVSTPKTLKLEFLPPSKKLRRLGRPCLYDVKITLQTEFGSAVVRIFTPPPKKKSLDALDGDP